MSIKETNLVTADGQILKEIGQVAFRNAAGDFTGKKSIYIKVSPEKVNPETQMLPQEENTVNEIAKLFAEKFGQYVKECKAQGIDVGI